MAGKKIVAANWKMNPSTVEEAKRIAERVRRSVSELKHTEVVVCPPFIFASAIISRSVSPHFHLGAQSVSYGEGNAHTGEVSAEMLKNAGVEYVIAGHSEMRAAGDTDLMVSKRIKAILDAGMIPLVCIGEKLRDLSGTHFDFIKEQMKNSLAGIPKSRSRDIILAYEPVWAIGAKAAMLPEEIYEMSLFVKKVYADIFGVDTGRKVQVLYGGSVTVRNAADIVRMGQVDGLLVGRESLNIAGFVELLKEVDGV